MPTPSSVFPRPFSTACVLFLAAPTVASTALSRPLFVFAGGGIEVRFVNPGIDVDAVSDNETLWPLRRFGRPSPFRPRCGPSPSASPRPYRPPRRCGRGARMVFRSRLASIRSSIWSLSTRTPVDALCAMAEVWNPEPVTMTTPKSIVVSINLFFFFIKSSVIAELISAHSSWSFKECASDSYPCIWLARSTPIVSIQCTSSVRNLREKAKNEAALAGAGVVRRPTRCTPRRCP